MRSHELDEWRGEAQRMSVNNIYSLVGLSSK